VPTLADFIKFIFFIALLPKILNSIAALSIIRLDFANVQEQLQRKSVLEDIGALTASIEHDIKNPLGVIDIELSRMRERFQSNAEVSAFVTRLDEQKQRIFAATQIIPVLRGDKDYYDRFMEKTNVLDMVNRSIKAVKRELNTNNIHFKTEDRNVYIKAYRPMFEQGLVNILRNSIEAIHEAQRKRGLISVTINADTQLLDMIKINIADNGSGIPEENLPKITKLFTTRKNRKANSGIGLFITNRIIKVHGGKLEVQSKVGEGTTVSLLLPKWRADSKAV
jgi:signal transduction histidine kinase